MAGAKSAEGDRKVVYGRGGAGNIGPPSPALKPSKDSKEVAIDDLDTPTLKTKNYTTGRGGTGNMAKNDPTRPELARGAQDVGVPVAAELKKEGQFHTGRGGTGNTYFPSDQEKAAAREHNRLVKTRSRSEGEEARKGTVGTTIDKMKGIAEKGKEKARGN